MYQIKKVISIAIVIFGLNLCFSISASAQTFPPGSYQQSCYKFQIVNKTDLKANCLTKEQGASSAFTSGNETTLPNFFGCSNEISNNDGNLDCNREGESPQMKAAKAAVNFCIINIFGRQPKKGEEFGWIKLMFKNGLEVSSFYKGLTPFAASTFFNHYLARPENGDMRLSAINAAFSKVYGSPSSPERQAFWDAKIKNGESNYSSIIATETKLQNSNLITRKLLILRTYKDTMGRAPTAAEQGYWFPRTEYYSQLIEAHRNWLYSPQGAKDLTETIKRALTEKYAKKSVNDNDIKSAMTQYAKDRKIFDEM